MRVSLEVIAAVTAGGMVGAALTWLALHRTHLKALSRWAAAASELKKKLIVATDAQTALTVELAKLRRSADQLHSKPVSETRARRRVTDLPDVAAMSDPFAASPTRRDPQGFEDTQILGND